MGIFKVFEAPPQLGVSGHRKVGAACNQLEMSRSASGTHDIRITMLHPGYRDMDVAPRIRAGEPPSPFRRTLETAPRQETQVCCRNVDHGGSNEIQGGCLLLSIVAGRISSAASNPLESCCFSHDKHRCWAMQLKLWVHMKDRRSLQRLLEKLHSTMATIVIAPDRTADAF